MATLPWKTRYQEKYMRLYAKVRFNVIHCIIIHGKIPCRRRWSILWWALTPKILWVFLHSFVHHHPNFLAFLPSFAVRHLKNWISVGDQITGSRGFVHLYVLYYCTFHQNWNLKIIPTSYFYFNFCLFLFFLSFFQH